MIDLLPPTRETPEAAPSRSDRHPDFDAYWEKYHSLVFWWDSRLVKAFGGEHHDYLGTLTLELNRRIYSFDESKGAFTTYFSKLLYGRVLFDFLRHESEHRRVRWFNDHSKAEEKREVHMTYSAHEIGNVFYRIPERADDWAMDVIDFMGGQNEMWAFVTAGMNPRHALVLERRYRWGHTQVAIGDDLGVSKQRIEQIERASLAHVREKLKKIELFKSLFDAAPDAANPSRPSPQPKGAQ